MIDIDEKVRNLLTPQLMAEKGLCPKGHWLEIKGFEWVTGPAITNFLLNEPPSVIGKDPVAQHDVLSNSSPFDAKLSTSFEICRGQSESIEISEAHQFSIGASVSVNYESPIGLSIGAEVNTSYAYDKGEVLGHSVDTTRITSSSFEVDVPAESHAKVEVLSTRHNIDAPWSAKLDLSQAEVIVDMVAHPWMVTDCFEHYGFAGDIMKVEGDKSLADIHRQGWSDRISSIIVWGVGTVWLYENPGFAGNVRKYVCDGTPIEIHGFGGIGWNDRISSIKQQVHPEKKQLRSTLKLADLADLSALSVSLKGRYRGEGVKSLATISGYTSTESKE